MRVVGCSLHCCRVKMAFAVATGGDVFLDCSAGVMSCEIVRETTETICDLAGGGRQRGGEDLSSLF